MGCATSTHVSCFDNLEEQILQTRLAPAHDREPARRRSVAPEKRVAKAERSCFNELEEHILHNHFAALHGREPAGRRSAAPEKQVTKAECSHNLPHSVEDDSTDCSAETGIRKWTEDWVDSVNSWGPDGFQKPSIQIHVPNHLQQFVKEEPVLKEFVEPSEMECSWDMPSLRERSKDLPAGIVVAPDREMHDQHVKHLDRFLAQVSTKPRQLEGDVYVKKLLCGLSPMPASVANRINRRKGALEALGLF